MRTQGVREWRTQKKRERSNVDRKGVRMENSKRKEKDLMLTEKE